MVLLSLTVSIKNPTLMILTPTLQRLVATCDVAANWCHCKAHGLLTARSLSAFLLVTLSDLKVNDLYNTEYCKSVTSKTSSS